MSDTPKRYVSFLQLFHFWFYQTFGSIKLCHKKCLSGSKVLNRFCHHLGTLAMLKVVFVIYFLITKQDILQYVLTCAQYDIAHLDKATSRRLILTVFLN